MATRGTVSSSVFIATRGTSGVSPSSVCVGFIACGASCGESFDASVVVVSDLVVAAFSESPSSAIVTTASNLGARRFGLGSRCLRSQSHAASLLRRRATVYEFVGVQRRDDARCLRLLLLSRLARLHDGRAFEGASSDCGGEGMGGTVSGFSVGSCRELRGLWEAGWKWRAGVLWVWC